MELLFIDFMPQIQFLKITLYLYVFLLLKKLSFSVLKAVEHLGVSYVKGSEQYQSKLEAEIRKVKFSFRVSKRGKKGSFSFCIFMY